MQSRLSGEGRSDQDRASAFGENRKLIRRCSHSRVDSLIADFRPFACHVDAVLTCRLYRAGRLQRR